MCKANSESRWTNKLYEAKLTTVKKRKFGGWKTWDPSNIGNNWENYCTCLKDFWFLVSGKTGVFEALCFGSSSTVFMVQLIFSHQILKIFLIYHLIFFFSYHYMLESCFFFWLCLRCSDGVLLSCTSTCWTFEKVNRWDSTKSPKESVALEDVPLAATEGKSCLQLGICKLDYWPDWCVAEVIIIRNYTLKMLPLLKRILEKVPLEDLSRDLNPNPAKAKGLPLLPFYFDL